MSPSVRAANVFPCMRGRARYQNPPSLALQSWKPWFQRGMRAPAVYGHVCCTRCGARQQQAQARLMGCCRHMWCGACKQGPQVYGVPRGCQALRRPSAHSGHRGAQARLRRKGKERHRKKEQAPTSTHLPTYQPSSRPAEPTALPSAAEGLATHRPRQKKTKETSSSASSSKGRPGYRMRAGPVALPNTLTEQALPRPRGAIEPLAPGPPETQLSRSTQHSSLAWRCCQPPPGWDACRVAQHAQRASQGPLAPP